MDKVFHQVPISYLGSKITSFNSTLDNIYKKNLRAAFCFQQNKCVTLQYCHHISCFCQCNKIKPIGSDASSSNLSKLLKFLSRLSPSPFCLSRAPANVSGTCEDPRGSRDPPGATTSCESAGRLKPSRTNQQGAVSGGSAHCSVGTNLCAAGSSQCSCFQYTYVQLRGGKKVFVLIIIFYVCRLGNLSI